MVFSGPVPQCPHCGLSLPGLDLKFGAIPRHSPFVSDSTGRLTAREISQLEEVFRLFSRKFPQSRFSVFLTSQIPNGVIGEYAFWLMNRARFGFTEAAGGENFDLLLVIDVEQMAAALVAGYGLENYVTERDLERALAEAATDFHRSDWVRGIHSCVDCMTNRMREIVGRLRESGSPSDAPVEELE